MAHITILSKEIRTLDGLYSLNDLHKAAGSESRYLPAHVLSNHPTKEFIADIENNANSHGFAVNCFGSDSRSSNGGAARKAKD